MLEEFIHYISHLSPLKIILISGLFSFLESFIPPLPSDVIVAFAAGILAKNQFDLIILFLFNTLFSFFGFFLTYKIGYSLKEKSFLKNSIKIQTLLAKAHAWFLKIGYYLILLNRFFPGIRSIIGFFSGINKLESKKVVILSILSCGLWNIILITSGKFISNNLGQIKNYLFQYTLGISFLLIIFIFLFFLFKKVLKN